MLCEDMYIQNTTTPTQSMKYTTRSVSYRNRVTYRSSHLLYCVTSTRFLIAHFVPIAARSLYSVSTCVVLFLIIVTTAMWPLYFSYLCAAAAYTRFGISYLLFPISNVSNTAIP
eukprot:735966_1